MLEEDNLLEGSPQGSRASSTLGGESIGDSGIDNGGYTSDSDTSSTTNDFIQCPNKVCRYKEDSSYLFYHSKPRST